MNQKEEGKQSNFFMMWNFLMMPAWAKIWNLKFEIYEKIYEKKTSEADLGVVKDKGGGEQFLNVEFTSFKASCRSAPQA